MNNKKDNILNWKEIVKAIIALIVMVGTLYGVINYIDWRIEAKISESEYMNKIASKIRPSIIFNSKGSITDLGGMQYIEKIKVEPGNIPIPKKVIVTPKKYMPNAPIITPINSATFSVHEERGVNFNWEYTFEGGFSTGDDIIRFRLEIIQ